MQACGPGVERLAEEVLQRSPTPALPFFQRHGDHAGSAESFVRSVTDGEVDIIIGTQMAAKGHHFPNLTLVGSSMPTSGLPAATFAPPSGASRCWRRWQGVLDVPIVRDWRCFRHWTAPTR